MFSDWRNRLQAFQQQHGLLVALGAATTPSSAASSSGPAVTRDGNVNVALSLKHISVAHRDAIARIASAGEVLVVAGLHKCRLCMLSTRWV